MNISDIGSQVNTFLAKKAVSRAISTFLSRLGVHGTAPTAGATAESKTAAMTVRTHREIMFD
jgi:hypothetical protein